MDEYNYIAAYVLLIKFIFGVLKNFGNKQQAVASVSGFFSQTRQPIEHFYYQYYNLNCWDMKTTSIYSDNQDT